MDQVQEPALARLPFELLDLIFFWTCKVSSKNDLLELRTVNKLFSTSLRKALFKTLQIDLPRLSHGGSESTARWGCLNALGTGVEAVHVNMMAIMGDDIEYLREQFENSLPEVCKQAESIFAHMERSCLGHKAMDAQTYGSRLQDVLRSTPHLNRLKLTLPLPMIETEDDDTIQILATTFAAFANRHVEHAPLETVVIHNLGDVAVERLFTNHLDLSNIFTAMASVKHLVLGLKRCLQSRRRVYPFAVNLWTLTHRIRTLESLCITGNQPDEGLMYGAGEKLTGISLGGIPVLQRLRCIELRRLTLDPEVLIYLCTETARTLKELYLVDVNLFDGQIYNGMYGGSRWIGHESVEKGSDDIWVAPSLVDIPDLNLHILKATRLGYQDTAYSRARGHRQDLDSTQDGRTFEERFVATIMGSRRSKISENNLPSKDCVVDHLADLTSTGGNRAVEEEAEPSLAPEASLCVDAEIYLRDVRNPTSRYRNGIDDVFPDSNQGLITNLRDLDSLASEGVQLINEDMIAALSATMD